MSRLPLYMVIFLSTAILVWNFSFYGVAGADPLTLVLADTARALDSTMAEALRTEAPAFPKGELDTPPAGSSAKARLALEGSSGRSGGPGSAALSEGAGAGVESGSRAEAADESLEYRVLLYESGARRAGGHYKDGLRVGPWIEWWENGQVRSEGEYEADEPEGDWSYYYSSGLQRLRGRYEDGYRAGLWRGWHENGQVMIEGAYDRADQEGPWTLWYSNGQVMESGHFENGKRVGIWSYFDFAGRPDIRTGEYVLGRRQQQQEH